MSADIAEIALVAKSDQIVTATDRLGRFTAAGKLAKTGTDKLADSIGKLIGAYATYEIASRFIRKFIADTSESERAQAQLAASLKSTGAVAGQTVEQLNDHANALKRITTYDDEAINGAQALLLTFTRIRGDVFPQATEAVLNLATALHTDLNSAALQVGKALNDPVLGMTALSRSGIQFSETQKRVVKEMMQTNNIVGAQKVILKELENQFGGSAQAARGTLGGAITALGNAFDDLFEATGPAADQMRDSIEKLIKAISDPAFIAAVQAAGIAIFNAFSAVIPVIQQILEFIARMGGAGASGVQNGLLSVPTSDLENKKRTWQEYAKTVESSVISTNRAKNELARIDAELAARTRRGGFDDVGGGIGSFTTLKNTFVPPKITKVDLGVTDEQVAASEKLKKAYDGILLSMKQKQDQSKLEQDAIGRTTDAVLKLTNRNDVLQDAEKKGIELTAGKRRELVKLADQLTDTQLETKRLTESQKVLEDAFSAVGDTITAVFNGGIKTFDDFVKHLLGGFAKLGEQNLSKLFSADSLSALMGGGSGGSTSGNSASWGTAQASVFGKAVKEGAKEGNIEGFGNLLKSIPGGAGTVGAGLGGLGLGYQSQSPLMGALGGAVAGAAAGPWGAVIGGLAGLVGGIMGMNDALEKSKAALSDNKSAIDIFIKSGFGEAISQDAAAVAQFKAQGNELIKLAQAAGDSGLVARLRAAQAAYADTLKNERAVAASRDKFTKLQQQAIDTTRAQADALGTVIEQQKSFITSLTSFRQALKLDKEFSTLNPQGMLTEAQSQFNALLKKAKLGDADAQNQLQGAASSYLEAARGYLGSSVGYTKIFDQVEAALGDAVGTATKRLTSAELQLAATNKQLALMGDVSKGITSLVSINANLVKLQTAVAKERGRDAAALLAEIKVLNKKLSVASVKRAA